MSVRQASCSCGQLSAQASGEPVRVSICHCLACQRRSGSAFAFQARYPRSNVAVSGSAHVFRLTGDEGTTATFHFCPQCGATVYYEMDAMPDMLAIPVGAFADPSFPIPDVSVYESRKHGWVTPPSGAEHYD